MKTKPTHTTTPWTTMEGKTLIHAEVANMNDGKPCGMPVCSIPKARREDAAFIVRAVNAHEMLLEALYQCRAYIPVIDRPKILDEAIAKAQGK